MKSFKILVVILFCLSITVAFAENNVTMKVCVTGDPFFSYKNVSGSFRVRRALNTIRLDSPINLGTTSKKCVQKTHHYEQEHTNKIVSHVSVYPSYEFKIVPDQSCRSGAFHAANETHFIIFGFDNRVPGLERIEVDNSYGKTPVDWGVEYDLMVRIESGAMPEIVLSCKLI